MKKDAERRWSPSPCSEISLHRLRMTIDGEEIMGATITCGRPANEAEMLELLRELVRMHEAPDVPDPEVLGMYSPNASDQATASGKHG